MSTETLFTDDGLKNYPMGYDHILTCLKCSCFLKWFHCFPRFSTLSARTDLIGCDSTRMSGITFAHPVRLIWLLQPTTTTSTPNLLVVEAIFNLKIPYTRLTRPPPLRLILPVASPRDLALDVTCLFSSHKNVRFLFSIRIIVIMFYFTRTFCTYDNLDAPGGGTVALTNGPVRIVIDRLGDK